MNKKQIPSLIGLINVLLRLHEPITIYINEEPLPSLRGCFMGYPSEDCDINKNLIVFELTDRIQDMMLVHVYDIRTISIEYIKGR